MVNRITNTPIDTKLYNARAITTNRGVTKNCVRQADGTLWALVADYACKVNLYKSTDNGFSWSIVLEGVESGTDMREQAGFETDGYYGYLVINERYRNLDIIQGEYESVGADGFVERDRYDLDDLDTAPAATTILTTGDNPVEGAFDICYNNEAAFIVWVDGAGYDINVTALSHRTTGVSSDATLATNAYTYLSSVVDDDGKINIAYLWDDGGTDKLSFVVCDSGDWTFNAPVLVDTPNADIATDIAIARDGFGTLCIVWFDEGDDLIHYATSIDSGANWDVNSLTRTSGHAAYTDSITSDVVGRTNVIGGSQGTGGFILTYCEDNAAGTPRCYVRQLTTADSGATYSLQAEKEVATADPYSTDSIVGVQFFLPTDTKLLDLSDPGLCRIAYTINEGDSTTMADTVDIHVGQELLWQSAYPSSLASEAAGSAHTLDTADSISLRVLVDIHAGPESNIDFYAAGLKGGFTDRYEAAFKRIGTRFRVLRYQPDALNDLSDISAYGAPTEFNTLALLDPVTYSFPSPALNRSTNIERVEQDVRKVHFPPDFPLLRTFLVNSGGYLKRTVWLIEFDGNQYEISQVIPRFISNQICFYEANCYVVGPSRDPFARTILPSET